MELGTRCTTERVQVGNSLPKAARVVFLPDIRTLRLTWWGLETWPWWNCAPIPQSKERNWKPSTYSRRACPRLYRRRGVVSNHGSLAGVVDNDSLFNVRVARTVDGGTAGWEVVPPPGVVPGVVHSV